MNTLNPNDNGDGSSRNGRDGNGSGSNSSSGSGNGPCGACKLLKRKCADTCVFAPYFASDGALLFASVHQVFGASNVSKLLAQIPVDQRLDAVFTICYEAQARVGDPVYGCVGQIYTLERKVASLEARLAYAEANLAAQPAPFPPQPQLPQPAPFPPFPPQPQQPQPAPFPPQPQQPQPQPPQPAPFPPQPQPAPFPPQPAPFPPQPQPPQPAPFPPQPQPPQPAPFPPQPQQPQPAPFPPQPQQPQPALFPPQPQPPQHLSMTSMVAGANDFSSIFQPIAQQPPSWSMQPHQIDPCQFGGTSGSLSSLLASPQGTASDYLALVQDLLNIPEPPPQNGDGASP